MVLMLQPTIVHAQEQIAPAEALARVRQAVGYEALRKLSGDVLIEGQSQYLGIPGNYQLQFSPRGGCVVTIEARGRHQDGFDGKTVWERVFSGLAHELDFGEAETQQAFLSIRSYSWLAEESPFQLMPGKGGQKPGEIAFQLLSKTGLVPTEIVLDRTTWLPVRASRSWVFGTLTWEFSDYVEHLGVKWPSRSRFLRGNEANQFDSKQVTLVPKQEAAFYRMPVEPSHVRWEASLPSRVELKRTASGHLFVKPRINGKDVGWFAFDTGTGSGMCISQKAADALKLPAFGKALAGGAGKQSEVRFREADSLQLGAATTKQLVMMEMPSEFTDAMSSLFGFDWGGTVGHDFISQVVAEFDLTNVTLDLFNPAKYELKNGAWLPLRLNHGIPCLKCKVEDQHEGWFQFDTGAGVVDCAFAGGREA